MEEGPGMLGSIFDEPSESEPKSGETDLDDNADALAEEMLMAFENRDAKALADIIRSIKAE